MRGPCTRELLAHTPGYRIESCSCGLTHVTAGPVTLRMEPKAMRALAVVLARAAHRLEAAAPKGDRPRLELVEGGPATAEG